MIWIVSRLSLIQYGMQINNESEEMRRGWGGASLVLTQLTRTEKCKINDINVNSNKSQGSVFLKSCAVFVPPIAVSISQTYRRWKCLTYWACVPTLVIRQPAFTSIYSRVEAAVELLVILKLLKKDLVLSDWPTKIITREFQEMAQWLL